MCLCCGCVAYPWFLEKSFLFAPVLHSGQTSANLIQSQNLCCSIFKSVVTDFKQTALIVLIDLSNCFFILINYCEYKLETKGCSKQFYLAIKISCHWICNSSSQIILWAEFLILCFNHNFLPLNIITERFKIITLFFSIKIRKSYSSIHLGV